MAIVKKPKSNKKSVSQNSDEKAVQAFIAGAEKEVVKTGGTKKPVMIRFDSELLERVDAAAKRRGISRSAWIQYTLSRALDHGEG